MNTLHAPANMKVHFAGLEKPNYALAAVTMGVNYGLYTAFPFLAERIFKKKVWPIIPFKWMDNYLLQVPVYINQNMRHTIQDSGLFSLLFGKHKDKATKEFVYKWFDELISWTLEHGQDVTCVEVDAQAILGVEETWKLREEMRAALPNNRIINVFHIEDGVKGLDRLIEYSDYLAIGSGIGDKDAFTKPLVDYIKERKSDIDIHLLGCTKESTLRKCAHLCTSCDSVTWLTQNRFGEFDNGMRIECIDTEKAKALIGTELWAQIREYTGDKITNSTIAAAELYKRRYAKWLGSQDYTRDFQK